MKLLVLVSSLAIWTPVRAGINEGEGCTSIIVGKGASVDGSPMTSHTDDCLNCDFRLSKVPPKDHPEGAMRPIFYGRAAYPRYLGDQFGSTYTVENTDTTLVSPPWHPGREDFKAIGYIPQVPHTYGYIDGSYGIINEYNLAIGESTCSGLLTAKPVNKGGKALLDAVTLSRIALERCKTARCAISTMGSLAEEYGFYGADDTYVEAGESLQIVDSNEAWIFHILADDTGSSAVWAAQRVPDGHLSVVANSFVIREIDLKDKENFMASTNLEKVATRAGLWPRPGYANGIHFYGYMWQQNFDWTGAFAQDRGHLSTYATRRMWRIFTLAAPSLYTKDWPLPGKLSPHTGVFADDYPFSVKPDRKLSVRDIMRFHRDHYEGTPYDMTRGLAAGPYGSPARWDPAGTARLYRSRKQGITNEEAWSSSFERAISMYRAAYSWVSQVRNRETTESGLGYGLVWFGQYAPHATQYIPVYAIVDETPTALSKGSHYKFDETVSYWVHAAVGNWANLFYLFIIGDIRALQKEQEDMRVNEQKQLELELTGLMAESETVGKSMVTEVVEAWAKLDVDTWWAFFKTIVAKFKDGQRLDRLEKQRTLNPTKLFYPRWWLEEVGFLKTDEDEPPQPPALQLASPTESGIAGMSTWLPTILVGAFGILLGMYIGRRQSRQDYTTIH